jgi:membrane protein
LIAEGGEPRLSNRMRERLALVIVSLISSHYVAGRPAWTLRQLTQALNVPMHAVDVVLVALVQGQLLVKSNDDPSAYLPARDLGAISVEQLLEVVRSAGEDRFLNPAGLPVPAPVAQVLARLDQALNAAAADISLKDLAVDSRASLLGETATTVRPNEVESPAA